MPLPAAGMPTHACTRSRRGRNRVRPYRWKPPAESISI